MLEPSLPKHNAKEVSLERAVALLKLRLERWSRLEADEVRKTIDANTAQAPIYVELFGDEKRQRSGCIGLMQFKRVMQHALKELSAPKQVEALNRDGYLYFKKSDLPDAEGIKELPESFLACTYEIYLDSREFVVMLQPHSKQAMRRKVDGSWERPKVKKPKAGISGKKQGDYSFVIGSNIDNAFTLAVDLSKGDSSSKKQQIEKEREILSRFSSPFIQKLLFSPKVGGLENSKQKIRMVGPRGICTLEDVESKNFKNMKALLLAMISGIRGLSVVHALDFYHQDVSEENVLLMDNGVLQFIDFEFAGKEEAIREQEQNHDTGNFVKLVNSYLVRPYLRQNQNLGADDRKKLEEFKQYLDVYLSNKKKNKEDFLKKLTELFPALVAEINQQLDELEAEKRRYPYVFSVSVPTDEEWRSMLALDREQHGLLAVDAINPVDQHLQKLPTLQLSDLSAKSIERQGSKDPESDSASLKSAGFFRTTQPAITPPAASVSASGSNKEAGDQKSAEGSGGGPDASFFQAASASISARSQKESAGSVPQPKGGSMNPS